jgi:hypothetical protein
MQRLLLLRQWQGAAAAAAAADGACAGALAIAVAAGHALHHLVVLLLLLTGRVCHTRTWAVHVAQQPLHRRGPPLLLAAAVVALAHAVACRHTHGGMRAVKTCTHGHAHAAGYTCTRGWIHKGSIA